MHNSEEEKGDIRDIFPDRQQQEELHKDMTAKNDFWIEKKQLFVDSIERKESVGTFLFVSQ